MAHTKYKKEKMIQGHHQFKVKQIQKYICHNVEKKNIEIGNIFLNKKQDVLQSEKKNEPRYASFIS